MQRFIVKITQENSDIIQRQDIECFVLSDNLTEDFAVCFVNEAHRYNKLVLLWGEQALDKYKKYDTDGFIIDASKADKPQKIVKSMQKSAPGAILGVISRNRRHEAMLISECEPDFIVFRIWTEGLEKNCELLSWYNELFLIQSAILPENDLNYESCAADFVIIDDVKLNLKK